MNVEQAKKLAGGVLSAVGVKSFQQDYQDYKQELLLLIWKAYTENRNVALTGNTMLFKFLKWRLIDMLRQSNRLQHYIEPTDQLPILSFDERERLEMRSIIETYMKCLNKNDKTYRLMALYLSKPGYMLSEYCQMLNIHRTTARRQLDRIKSDFEVIEYDK